jgi:hypothetical protein
MLGMVLIAGIYLTAAMGFYDARRYPDMTLFDFIKIQLFWMALLYTGVSLIKGQWLW